MKKRALTKDELLQLACARACSRHHEWKEIADHFGSTYHAIRNQWRRYAKKLNIGAEPCPLCVSCGAFGERREQAKWDEQGNYAEARTTGVRVRSLEELLEVVKPDLNVWKVIDWGVKKWEVGAKIEKGHLEFDEGKITGHLTKEGLGVQDLWSVWAKFVRREPVFLKPVIQPIQCDVAYDPLEGRRADQYPSSAALAGLLLPDPHLGYERDLRTGALRPFHDRRALDLGVQIAAAVQPATIAILGDFLDLTMFTDKFIRSPTFYFTTQPSVLEGHWYLRRLREACPEARIVLLGGNHEERMEKILSTHLLEACGLKAADELELPPALSVPKLLALHQLQIEWIGEYPDGEVWLGPLRCTHGERVSQVPGGSARAVADSGDVHTAFGHVHRIEMVSKRVRTRGGWRTVRAISPGCLCHIDGRVPGSGRGDNWQQGLAVVEYKDFAYTVTPIEIMEGVCVYQGSSWRGQDYTAALGEVWPEWNWGGD